MIVSIVVNKKSNAVFGWIVVQLFILFVRQTIIEI